MQAPPLIPSLPPLIFSIFTFFFAFLTISSQTHTYIHTHTHTHKFYNWTATKNFGYGTYVVWRLTSVSDRKVNIDNTQVHNGACNDCFTSPHWQKFYSNPYGKLTEDYFQCTQLLNDALVNAIGVAAGTSASLVNLIFSALVWLIMTATAFSTLAEKRQVLTPVEFLDENIVEPSDAPDVNFAKINQDLAMIKTKVREHDGELTLL